MSTLELLAYNERGFAEAVRAVLPSMVFVPAELDAKKVRQVVTYPFTFTIDGDQPWDCKPDARVR